jgi:prepilin-type N-terminal cleavage/methylation domain-containing protein
MNSKESGFTIIELAVVISIMVIISGVALVNHTKFGNSILLTNLAYDISLSIRQAQQFGTAVRSASGSFDTGYGVRFERSDKTHYSLFSDSDRNHAYGEGIDNIIETYTLRRNSEIGHFCGTKSDGSEECSKGKDKINWLDIVFDRPQPGSISDAFILSDRTPSYQSARIIVENAQGETKEVHIEITGQISVK